MLYYPMISVLGRSLNMRSTRLSAGRWRRESVMAHHSSEESLVKNWIRGALWAAGIVAGSALADTRAWTLSVVPRQNKEQAQAMYSHLATWIATETGHPVTYMQDTDWTSLAIRVRYHAPTVIIGGPQLLGWLVQHKQYHVLVAPEAKLQFVLTGPPFPVPGNLQSMAGQMVCAPLAPNLATLLWENEFAADPLSQPVINPVSSWGDGLKQQAAGRCRWTLTPAGFVTHQTIQWKSAMVPNQGIAVAPSMPAAMRQRLRAALLSPAGLAALAPIEKAFHLHNTPFGPARSEDYRSFGPLLAQFPGWTAASGAQVASSNAP